MFLWCCILLQTDNLFGKKNSALICFDFFFLLLCNYWSFSSKFRSQNHSSTPCRLNKSHHSFLYCVVVARLFSVIIHFYLSGLRREYIRFKWFKRLIRHCTKSSLIGMQCAICTRHTHRMNSIIRLWVIVYGKCSRADDEFVSSSSHKLLFQL